MGKYALLIGVGSYGKGLQSLPAADKDAAALSEVLLHPKMGGFDKAELLINPTQSEMSREIELWFQGRKPEDLVLLFFSGHGIKDERRDLYFAATNTEKQRDRLMRSTAISARFIHDCIRSCKAKYQVLILDCCFSGAFGDLVTRDDGEVNLKDQLGAEGRAVLTSTSSVDYSFEEKGADLSIYTRYLVEGIASGAADEDEDGVITVDELHRYAGRKVRDTSPTMSPTLITLKDEGFRVQVARSPQDDPRLRYRKEVELRAASGEFSIPAKRLLAALRTELQLSDVEAEVIETEVLKPYREYKRKQQDYQDTLHQCLQSESLLRPRTINDLKDYRAHLRLRPEDVASVEQAALNGNDLEEYEEKLEQQRHKEKQQQRVQTSAECRAQKDIQIQQKVIEQKQEYEQEVTKKIKLGLPINDSYIRGQLRQLQHRLEIGDEDAEFIEIQVLERIGDRKNSASTQSSLQDTQNQAHTSSKRIQEATPKNKLNNINSLRNVPSDLSTHQGNNLLNTASSDNLKLLLAVIASTVVLVILSPVINRISPDPHSPPSPQGLYHKPQSHTYLIYS
jgi:hypothetical protein